MGKSKINCTVNKNLTAIYILRTKKCIMKASVFILFILIVFAFSNCQSNKPENLLITGDMIINETGSGNHMAWFDEQNFDTVPVTHWDTYGVQTFWPAGIIIDLG